MYLCAGGLGVFVCRGVMSVCKGLTVCGGVDLCELGG